MIARESEIAIGALAGLAGMAAMLAMRSFDQRYAPMTIAKIRHNPAKSLVVQLKSAFCPADKVSKPLEHAAATVAHLAAGALVGVAYALIRPRDADHLSSLKEGTVVGAAFYVLEHLGFRPPVWKQRFPEITGELLRHLAYGVATAATHGALSRHTAGRKP